MFANFFNKNDGIEKSVVQGLDVIRSLIGIMEKKGTVSDPFIMANQIRDLETEFENTNRKIVGMITRKYMHPVCWEDLLKFANRTRQLLNQFIMIFNKIQIFRNEESYVLFYEHEKRILDNFSNFITEYSKNRKYAYQIIINNQYEFKDFMKNYFSKLNEISSERNCKSFKIVPDPSGTATLLKRSNLLKSNS